MPRPIGRSVVTSSFIDASHGSNKVGHVLFVNRAPVKWMNNSQQTVDTSAFTLEFIALKKCIEDFEHLIFKLRMFRIPVSE